MPEVSEDFRVWTVRIKPGIYFQDDAAFKGVNARAGRRRLRLLLEAILRSTLEVTGYRGSDRLKILGMAALREAALKDKQPFNYDTTVEGMRALDRYTVQFKLAEPQPRFLETHGGRRSVGCGRA